MRNMITAPIRNTLYSAIVMAFTFTPFAASAQGTLLPACVKEEIPGVNCALETMVSISRFLFGIMGSAALLMFVAGGFFIVAAGGRDAWIKKGKEYVKNAVIGIAIILLSGYAIQYGVNVLRGGEEGIACTGEFYTDESGKQQCCPAGQGISINPQSKAFECKPLPK